ncbi:COG0488: ATPase components of ABC transporters with duplicated ATPase domains, partial [hydrothermal vent metagenome]
MITLNNISMGFTKRTLFKDVSLSIFPKEKIGLTGPNGAGKTTLFSIILGQMESVSGHVQIQKNINIGYLPQESKFHSERTVMEELTEGDVRIRKLMSEKRKLEDKEKAMTDRYGDVLHELEQLGIYELEHKAEKILFGLGFKQEDFHRPILHLSGGWQMRTLLAKLLVYPYDLILLDEPTNYLDLDATLWLKDYLGSYSDAFVLISHDRVFLNEVTNYTILLEGAKMTKVKGNYAMYEQQRDISLKSMERRQKVVEKKRQQLERFTQRFHAQPNLASAVRNKRKMIDKLEKFDTPQDSKSMGEFQFSDIPSSGYVVAQAEGISKSYDDKQVYKDLSFEIIRGQKICFVGPNGAGKSTLLKMLAKVLEQDSGAIKYGHNVETGYFSQSRLDVLNPNRNAFEEVISSGAAGTPALKARSLLGLFNFRGDDVFKPVTVLSGGEKSRLILAKLLVNPPNFMLLDEPTTHLDLDGVR